MLEKYEVCSGLLHGFDWSNWTTGTPQERLGFCLRPRTSPGAGRREEPLVASRARVCRRPSRSLCRTKRRCASATTWPFSRPCAQCLAKRAPGEAKTQEELDLRRSADRLTRRCLRRRDGHLRRCRTEEAGHLDSLRRILGRSARHAATNLAVELLRKLLNGEIQTRSRKNVVQAQSFAEMLEQALRSYQNRAIEAAQVIEEMIALGASDMREANERGRTAKAHRR